MLKVFISHQRLDAALATGIAARLRTQQVDCYLDVIDPYVGGSINLLADHIQAEMSKCTQLLAVVSSATSASQWVPWEIGMATEKDFPLATFSGGNHLPPEFLRKWPYLRNPAELDEYVRISKATQTSFMRKRSINETAARLETTRDFHRSLKAALGQ